MPVNFGGKVLKRGDKVRLVAEVEGEVDLYSEETQEVSFRVTGMKGKLGDLDVVISFSDVKTAEGGHVSLVAEEEDVAPEDVNLFLNAKLVRARG